MSTLEDVKRLTESPIHHISQAATKALELNRELVNGNLTAAEYNELLDDVVRLDSIEKDMISIEIYRLIVQAYHTILTLKTIASL